MSLDLDFGDISGVEPREIPHEESDLEDAVIWRGCHWKVLKKSKYVKKNFWYDVICRGLPGFGSNRFFW